jgi:RND superfamily putative drug exporter
VLARWGTIVYRRRWAALALSAGLVALAFTGVLKGVSPSSNGSPTDTQSGTASTLATSQLPAQHGPSLTLLYRSATLKAADPAFRDALESSVAPVRADPRVGSVATPYDAGPAGAGLVSRDGHEALAVVTLRQDPARSGVKYADLRPEIGPSAPLEVSATGGLAITNAFTTQLGHDLSIASRASVLVTAILLLLVFGTVVAAGLPLGVGALAVLSGLGGLFVMARFTDVSQYATDLTALIGLGVGVDYSLFIVSRFREQLARGDTPQESLEVALATAGRSVVFSGLAVCIGLSGMLFFRGSYLGTMGFGGAFAVAAAVVYALTLLPALLAILGHRVERLRLPGLGRRRDRRGFWAWLAARVMRRPVLTLVPALAILAVPASPVLGLQMGSSQITLLPPEQEARWASDQIARNFPHRDQEVIPVVLDYGSGDPLSAGHAAYASSLAGRIAAMPGVLAVDDPASPTAPAAVRRAGTGAHVLQLSVHTSYQPSSAQAKSLVDGIRGLAGPPDGRKLVGGSTAAVMDDVAWILARSPMAAAFVVLVTYAILFMLVGSVLLPLKAILTNVISLAASFGAIVWVFQQGHLSGPLDFTPQTLGPSSAVLICCILFGLSMDYEVLMLTRIQEEWRRTGDTTASVETGLERSGRLVTGAAAIMVAVFACFGLGAGAVVIKAIGLGLTMAIAIDATIVRAVVVPAIMRMLGDLSWWAPGPLARLQRRAGLGKAADAVEPEAA